MSFLEPADMMSGAPLPGWSGRFFHAENMTFAIYDIADGAAPLNEHHHEQEEVWNIIEGEVLVTVGGASRMVSAGAAVIVPPNTPHSVTPTGACRAVIADYPVRTHLPGLSNLTEE
jgi:mannose-6-phosphate isomerase-like protein (cupin superfamily)